MRVRQFTRVSGQRILTCEFLLLNTHDLVLGYASLD